MKMSAPKSEIRLLIVDDHQMMIDGIKSLLLYESDFRIVAETTQPKDVMGLLAKEQADIVIADVSMPGITGIELTKLIRNQYPTIHVLALSMHGDRDTISDMLEAGISGYVLKNTGKDELLEALHKIASGGLFFSEDVTREMMRSVRSSRPTPVVEKIRLTPREIEIVKLIAAEYSNAQIGDALFISERTVETHRKNIFRKTATKSVAGLIKLVMEQGFLD